MRWVLCLALGLGAAVASECQAADCDATVLIQQKKADPPDAEEDLSKKESGEPEEPDSNAAESDDTAESNAPAKDTKEWKNFAPGPGGCKDIIEAMGRGINIGNTYDMNQDDQDPSVVKERVKWISDSGFDHVRLPVTWGSSFDPNSDLTKKVTEVVDYALSLGLFVVLNAHHETWLKEHYDGSRYYNDLFWSLWHNIALHFESRDSRLVFELLNEPEKAFGSWPGAGNWPSPFEQVAIDRTRTINGVGYDAVRRVSTDRMIFVSPNAMASIGTASYIYPNKENLPGGTTDECLGVEVHTYDPWGFAGDTGTNSFYGTIPRMKQGLYDTWRNLHIWAFQTDMKLYVGEFGVGRRDCCKQERNTDLVREYYRFAMNHFRANGWAAAAWDDPGWFAIYHAQDDGLENELMDGY